MAFSYQAPHHPFDLLDSSSVYLPKTQVVETLLVPPHHAFPGDHLSTAGAGAGASSSSSCFTITTFHCPSSINAPRKEIYCTKKKRESGEDQESLIAGEYSKDGKDTLTEQKRAKKKAKADETKKASSSSCFNPNGGYIHVRARRGQATDSHSLAERVRRERISERMKMLQGLVPGCEKVTGKALMLDEIINYVQSLQNQVEFLSMRIASLSPVLYDFNANLDDCVNQHPALPSLDQATKASDHGQANNYQMMECPPFQVQGPTPFSQVDGGSGLHGAQRSVGFIDQLGVIDDDDDTAHGYGRREGTSPIQGYMQQQQY